MKGCNAVRRHGFTLVEMLTVVAVFGLVAIYVGRVLMVNERAYHTVEETSESQQNLRMFGEMLEDGVRHAGMMVSRDAAVCGVDATNGPDLLYVSDSAAIDPQDDFDPYDGATVTSPANLTVGTSNTVTLGSLVIEPSPPNRPAYDTNSDGTLDSDFRAGGGVILTDLANPGRGAACGRITLVDLANNRLLVDGVADMASNGTNVIAVPANEYRISGTQLLWNGIVLAEGIEDFQVGYILDQGDDNVIDVPADLRSVGTWNGTATVAYSSSTVQANWVRELMISLVSRARRPDPEFTGRPQAFLNRTPIVTADGFRRRTLETRIRLRNLVARIDT